MLNKRPTAGNINILFYLLHKRLPNSELPYSIPVQINIICGQHHQEKFEDTKLVIRSRNSKNTQYNGQKKNDKNLNILKICKSLHRKL